MKLRTIVIAGAVVALAGLAVVGGSLWWLYASRDSLVKSAIERYGPQLTGVSVKVSAVKLEPAEGRGAIQGLELGNPAGFKAPRAMTLGEMRLAIDASTITSEVIRVKEVVLDAPAITYERGGGSDNLTVIQKHVDAEVARLAGPKKADAGPGKKFIIDNLHVRKARVSYGETASLPVPDLHLRDIGRKSNGASAGEVVKAVWDALTRSVTGVASRAWGSVRDGAKGAIEGARGLFK